MKPFANLRPRRAERLVWAVLLFSLPCFGAGCMSNDEVPSTIGTRAAFESATTAGPVTIEAEVLGCSTHNSSMEEFLRDALMKIKSEKNGLVQVRAYGDLGVAAMYSNCLGVAEEALSRATCLSERIDKKVSKGPESAKFFKGEPHEKALMYFYLGLCDFAHGDYENARACFRRAALQDAMAEKDVDRGDWLAMDLFQLRSDYLARGHIADEDMVSQLKSRYVQKADSSGTADESSSQTELNRLVTEQGENARSLIEMPINSDIMVVVALGQPPRKIAYGENGAQLGYVETASRVHSVKIHLPQRSPQIVPVADNTYVQSVTRGQRQMDVVLQHRERMKTAMISGGQVLQVAGEAVGGLYGLPLQIAGKLLAQRGIKKDVSADTRQIRLIPGRILLWCARRKEVGQSFKVTFEDEKGNILATTDKIIIPADGRYIILLRYGG